MVEEISREKNERERRAGEAAISEEARVAMVCVCQETRTAVGRRLCTQKCDCGYGTVEDAAGDERGRDGGGTLTRDDDRRRERRVSRKSGEVGLLLGWGPRKVNKRPQKGTPSPALAPHQRASVPGSRSRVPPATEDSISATRLLRRTSSSCKFTSQPVPFFQPPPRQYVNSMPTPQHQHSLSLRLADKQSAVHTLPGFERNGRTF